MITLSQEILPQLKEQAENLTTPFLGALILKLNEIEREMRWTSQPQVLLEAGLVEIMFQGNTPQASNKATEIEYKPKPKSTKVKTEESKQTQASKETLGEVTYVNVRRTTTKERDNMNFSEIKRRWGDILDRVKQNKITAHAFLIAGEPKAIDDKGFLLISFDETHKFHYDQISKPENRSIVEKALLEVIGWKINVSCTLEGQNNDGTNPKENSALNKALEFFGGNIVEIKE
jgi:DNA polymerase-3 subunit gamma/tau